MDQPRVAPVAVVLALCVLISVVVGLVSRAAVVAEWAAEDDEPVRSTALRIRPTPTPLAIEHRPLTLADFGLPPTHSCAGERPRADDWTQRLDADLDGDGAAEIVRLRAGPVINPGRGMIEMVVEFGDGRIHQGRLLDHRFGVALEDRHRQARAIRIDGTSQDVILFSNRGDGWDVVPASVLISMQDCQPLIVAEVGHEGDTWCRSGVAGQTKIELTHTRLRVRDREVEELAVLLPGCDGNAEDAGN